MGDADTLFRLAALNSEYAACIDADRLEDWPGLFVEQCTYKITTADNQRRGYAVGIVYADSRAMLQDRVAALREGVARRPDDLALNGRCLVFQGQP